ncbi:MAG: N-acetylmuramoyl-L-alanine amidase [Pseudomonadota bacterium]
MRRVLALLLALMAWPVAAQDLSALARLVPDRSAIAMAGPDVQVTLGLTQPVPWRVRLLDSPPRVVIDTREVDWAGLPDIGQTGPMVAMRAGIFRPGWSRLVMELSGPHLVSQAEMATSDAGAQLRLTLTPATSQAFAAAAGLPEPAEWALPKPAEVALLPPRGAGPVMVVLDPGHGGLDPGAERDGQTEAVLMLTFARELKELLLRDGRFVVVMTREENVFVPLETRISIARAAAAQVFLSLHADALAEGQASGATIYTLSEEASDEASATLAERHDRDDLLAGVDLTEQDDLVAGVLMDMARTTTEPRTERLAQALAAAVKAAEVRMHPTPLQRAGFSVLKSPDIPSALIELGFLSSSRDLARLVDAEWRARLAAALRDGLLAWVAEDAAISAMQQN